MSCRITFVFSLIFAFALTTTAQQQSPLDIALRHIEQNLEELQLTETDIANYTVSDLYTSRHNGVTHVYLKQHHNGIPIPNAIINVNILPDGRVLNMGNRFVSNLAAKVNAITPSISPQTALQKVVDQFLDEPSVSLKAPGRGQ